MVMLPTPTMQLSRIPLFSLHVLFIFLLQTNVNNRFCSAASFISSNHSLSGNNNITSEGGNFVLGFFSPGTTRNHYIGIWYGNIPKQTIVWVANREKPISDPSTSELKISGDGNLVLLTNQPKHKKWSTSTSVTSNSTVAVLLDTGNLVLRDGSNSSLVFWQSFDHPTNTRLPGSKLGINKVTGRRQIVTSWKNSEDPSPGLYSNSINPNRIAEFVFQWNSSKVYWTSGDWNGRFFNNIPEMTSGALFNSVYVDDDKEAYMAYTVQQNLTMIFRGVMDVSGQMMQFAWLENSQDWTQLWARPNAQCEVYATCGSFGTCDIKTFPYCSCVKGFEQASPKNWNLGDHSGGCVRKTPLHCAPTADIGADGFYPMPDVKLPDNPMVSEARTVEECQATCLSNCSCVAYSYGANGCSVWHGDLLNLQQLSENPDGGTTLYIRLAASELPVIKSKKRITIFAIVGTIMVMFSGISVLVVVVWLLQRRRRAKRFNKIRVVDGELLPFKYNDLRRMTKNFSEKLGEGSFGSVFKGILPDSTVVAVKKLRGVIQGEKQFRAEVSTIGKIQHINLVSLHGLCSEDSERLLVYEYMPRGSLADVLFQNSSPVLDWKKRYQIALGIARGLSYLHEECRDCIIHCDIKPENILLDAGFVPKVADFGLAKIIGREFSRVLTTIRGTVGYLSPEFISGTAITAKTDIYSYGMVLLELVSGRRNTAQSGESVLDFFPLLAATKLLEREIPGLLDSRLGGDADFKEVEQVCRVACWCIQDDEDLRPSMRQVVQILEGVLDINMPPIPRSLRFLA